MKLILSIIAAMTLASPSFAETIKVPVGQQSQQSEINRPERGMKKEQVLATFGEPLSQSTPTGTPPISNWKYSNFVVYFEYNHVIHSVLIHKRRDQKTQ